MHNPGGFIKLPRASATRWRDVPPSAVKVWLSLVVAADYSDWVAEVTYKQIMTTAGLSRGAVSAALRALEGVAALERLPGAGRYRVSPDFRLAPGPCPYIEKKKEKRKKKRGGKNVG